jgi:hypothetical protein
MPKAELVRSGQARSTRSSCALSPVLCLAGTFVGELEEIDRVVHVGWCVDGERYPSGVGEDVVGLCLTGGDEFVAYATREREVGDAVAVEVSELASSEAKLDAAEAVRRGLNSWPGGDCGGDLVGSVWLFVSHFEVLGSFGASDGSQLAAVVVDDLPCDEATLVGGQERHERCGVGWFTDSAEGEGCAHLRALLG